MELQKVICADDCDACEQCGEPVCPLCKTHYADCPCPGPTQGDEFHYKTVDGVLYAYAKEDGPPTPTLP